MDSIKNRYLDDHLGNFIDALAIAQDESAVRFALQRLARNAGFDHFSYMDLHAGDNRVLSDCPIEWQLKYGAPDFFRRDPVVVKAGRTMRPVIWSHGEQKKHSEEVRRYFDEARKFGLASGITLPIRGRFGSTVMLSLISSREETSTIAVRDVAYAATAVAFVHASLLRLSRQAARDVDTILSPRELHCMIWASMGKTKAETGKLIQISEKTVRFYLERARDKLGATNITHAVRIAMERELL